MNFCNLTQVRKNSGAVRPIRRLPQAAYPMVKLTQAEIAAMIHRKEERMKTLLAAEEERRQKSGKKKKGKKAVKQVKNVIKTLSCHFLSRCQCLSLPVTTTKV
jgi:hypothetical protein